MLRHKTIMKSKTTFLILLSVGLVLATGGMFFRPVHAQTWVEGHIIEDTTWTVTDSPFVVIGDVIVDANTTLTIEPGVEVRFGDGLFLKVNGNLNAVGTSEQPIVFTSNRIHPNPPFPGAWNGLRFLGNENTSFILSHSKISFATEGIYLANTGNALVKFSEVSDCSRNGLFVNQKVVTVQTANVQNNKFFDNGRHGMHICPNNDKIANLTVVENSFYDNMLSGLYIEYASEVLNFTVSGNSIYRNGISGDAYPGLDVRVSANITGNHIFSNHHRGVWLYSECVLNGNVVSANNDVGVVAWGPSIIINNSISYNNEGIRGRAYGGTLEVHYNDIHSNYAYGVYRNDYDINATHNYWGDATGPYHESLNPTGLGNEVNGDGNNLRFIPFLSSPFRSINERPIAHLESSPAQPIVNQTVTFNASLSTDDGRVDYYFFDFGDGTNSSWTSLSVVTHKYASEGTYNATLVVMDDFGVTSLDGNLVYTEITVVPEFPSSLILPLFMIVTLLAVIIYRKKHST